MVHERTLINFPLILRSELLAQYGSHPASTSAAPVPATSRSSLPNSSIPDAAVASTSSASIFPAEEEGNNSLADLSLSQIDPGVLAELPAYLQAEIRSHYRRGPPAALAADSGTAPPTNSSPAKKLNVKKVVGTMAKKRGRPPKNSVKAPKNTVQKPGKENDAEVANMNNNSKVQHGVIENVRLPEMSEESQLSRDSRSCQTADSQGVGVGRSPRPTFCGKTSVADIRPLIKVIDFSFHQCCGSVTFWYGSGCGSGSSDPYLPLCNGSVFGSGRSKNNEGSECGTLVKSHKKSQNSRNQGFSYYFCLTMEGSGSVTNGCGCGSGMAKNIWMLRIRIHSTAFHIRVPSYFTLFALLCYLNPVGLNRNGCDQQMTRSVRTFR